MTTELHIGDPETVVTIGSDSRNALFLRGKLLAQTATLTGQVYAYNAATGAFDLAIPAPTTPSYLVLSVDAALLAERVLTAGVGIGLVDNGAGSTLVISATGAVANSYAKSFMVMGA